MPRRNPRHRLFLLLIPAFAAFFLIIWMFTKLHDLARNPTLEQHRGASHQTGEALSFSALTENESIVIDEYGDARHGRQFLIKGGHNKTMVVYESEIHWNAGTVSETVPGNVLQICPLSQNEVEGFERMFQLLNDRKTDLRSSHPTYYCVTYSRDGRPVGEARYIDGSGLVWMLTDRPVDPGARVDWALGLELSTQELEKIITPHAVWLRYRRADEGEK